MKLKPSARKASSKAKEVASSAVHPNTLPPKHSGDTMISVRPSRRIVMASSLCVIVETSRVEALYPPASCAQALGQDKPEGRGGEPLDLGSSSGLADG